VRKNLAEAGLNAGDIPEKARAEDLSLSDWLNLCRVEDFTSFTRQDLVTDKDLVTPSFTRQDLVTDKT